MSVGNQISQSSHAIPVSLQDLLERDTFLLLSTVSSRNTSSDVFSEYIDYFITHILLIQQKRTFAAHYEKTALKSTLCA
jgi:hypothetical protein